MAGELISESAKLLEDLRVMLEKGGQFVVEQAPPLAKEIVAYHRIIDPLYVVAGLLLMASSVLLIKRVKRAWRDLDSEFAGVGGMLYCFIAMICGFGMFACNFESSIMVWVAPRLFLLDYVRHFIGGK